MEHLRRQDHPLRDGVQHAGAGTMPPSYNVIEFDSEKVTITLREPGKGKGEPLASFAREAVTTSRFYPDFDRFVKYDKLPFLRD
jgi:3',5'-cyclic-AMP phosphodiesterase